nr:hypothetical protein CFP56_53441 [Quercus suber]
MHSEGIESFGEAGHPKNRNIMATIEDLQRSQAAMQYVDALIVELRLREFSKSLEGRAFTWYTSLTPGSVLSWNDLATQFMKKFFTLKEKLTLSDQQCEKQMMSEGLLEYIRRGSTSQAVSTPKQPWRREGKKVEVAVAEDPKKVVKNKKRERGGILPPFTISTKKLYSILEAWLKDDVVVLLECKCEPTKEEKRGPLFYRYHRRCDHHTMNCYALRNIFHDRVAKRDLVIKVGKRADLRMRRPEVAMTFFMSHEDPMEEEAENMASSSSAPPPLLDEEMGGDKKDGKPNSPNLMQQPKEVHVVKGPVKEVPKYMNDVVRNV